MFTHAPYAILGDFSIVYGKTTKTACGKRRQTRTLVSRIDATCPECVAQIARDRAELASMEQSAIDAGLISREQLDRAGRTTPWKPGVPQYVRPLPLFLGAKIRHPESGVEGTVIGDYEEVGYFDGRAQSWTMYVVQFAGYSGNASASRWAEDGWKVVS